MLGTESVDPRQVVLRWTSAMSEHDLEAAVDCFAVDYHDVTPTRPGQEFRGRERVRQNFSALFGSVPDLRADVIRSVVDGDTVWMEWRMHGVRADGVAFDYAGVNIFGVADGRFVWGRIHTHPVGAEGNIEAQLERMTTSAPTAAT